jgi:hypothetical protein
MYLLVMSLVLNPSLVDIKGGEAGEVLGGGQGGLLPSLGSVVEAGGAEDEGVALPRLLVLRLQPDESLHLRSQICL